MPYTPMPYTHETMVPQRMRLIGTPDCPAIVDVVKRHTSAQDRLAKEDARHETHKRPAERMP